LLVPTTNITYSTMAERTIDTPRTERYAPNWIRRVEKEMSRSAFTMVDECDGDTGVDELAEWLKTISSVMSITGSV
jgi:hypothetical protein